MTRRRILYSALAVLLLPALTLAQLSIGPVITFDPTAVAKILKETIEVIRVASTTMMVYDQLKMDSQFARNKYIWRGAVMNAVDSAIWSHSTVTDPWAQTAMRGLGAASAWGAAAVRIQSNPSVLVMGTPFSANYASAQIGAHSGQVALQTLGQARVAQAAMAAPITACESSALSEDPVMNTEAAQQNVSTACQALLLQQSQTQLALDTARLDLELTRTKMQVDGMTEYSNMLIGAQQYGTSQALVPGNLAQTEQSYIPK